MSTLYLLPNLLDPMGTYKEYIPESICNIVSSLDGLFAESEKGARKYLLQFMDREKMNEISVKLLNEHTDQDEISAYISLIENKRTWGIISDAGLPVLADPGSALVYLAHQKKIDVKTVPGPSSILMGLILSGFSGQSFAFHGYLPRKDQELIKKILLMEKMGERSTQIWIEAPYRTDKMVEFCIKSLHPKALFCVASSLCTKDEKVITASIGDWKKRKIHFGKTPAVFLLSRQKK